MGKIISTEVVNTFLSGHDPMEHIITIECDYQEDKVSIIYVNDKGQKRVKLDDFKPFIWCKNSAAIRLYDGDRQKLIKAMRTYGINCKKLKTTEEGQKEVSERLENGYKYMFYATRRMSYQTFLKFFKEAGVPVHDNKKNSQGESNREFMGVTPVEQYMIQTGKRLFKGYDNYNDLNRFTFDLETEGLNPRVHRISQIGLRNNRGVKKIISITGSTKEELDKNEISAIELFLYILSIVKPDTVVGHNSENFDWDFFIVRCEELGLSFKDLSLKYFKHPIFKKQKEAVLKLGGEVEYYKPTVMWGHIILDSLHAARRAQALDSNMKKSGLKYVTQYLELKKPNRVYVPGDKINKTWAITDEIFGFCEEDGDWYTVTEKRPLLPGYELKSGRYIVERYLLDDLWETEKVEEKLNESNFLVGKMLPTTFTRACTMGTAGIWKLIMLAWGYENGLAIPAAAPSKRFTGGLSRLLKTGFVDRIVKLDYNSLYPSIILTWHVSTPIDIMNVMLSFLEYILTQREKYKDLKGAAGAKADELKKQLEEYEGMDDTFKKKLAEEIQKWKIEKTGNDKKQLPLKILANSFFGSYGAPNIFPYGDVIAAEKTTCIGRMSLRLMIYHFTQIGYTPIVGDSVTYDTPILIRREDKRINIVPICDIFNNNEAIEFGEEQYRDFSHKNYEVLTRNGWKPIEYVYKHKTTKQLKRVETKNGVIDCTEDHSLFDNSGNEVKPSTLVRGDKIEIYNNDIDYFASSTVTDREAWLFGFFMADGSSVYCDRTQRYFSKRKGEYVIHMGKRANWKISNKSLDRLNKAKEIMENSFCLKASIKDHRTSSNVYNLVVENAENAKFFSNNFYTSYRYKKVPEFILNASKEVKKAFLDGFCCGDGQNDTIDECIEFGQKSKVAMAGLYFIMKELGYNFRCHNRNDKPEFISFRLRNHHGNLLNENYSERKEDEVWNCSNITSKSEYVYDISSDGTFVNALGMVVCHNTDGFNFQMPPEDKFRYTDEHPYIGKGLGRNVKAGKSYTKVEADVAEFEDLYMAQAYNGGINKMGLGIDEYCDATINFARKNYADLMPNGKTKKVGNTIKSRKMSGYLEKFIDEGVDLLLHNNGYKFLNNYYDYIEKIYNYQIPIKDIASKGNIKKSLKEYIADCQTLTKAGSKKSRQAWYELAIKEGLTPNVSDTIYYINTGTKKGHSDVKRVTHFYYYNDSGEKVEVSKEVEKFYKNMTDEEKSQKLTRLDLAKKNYGEKAFDEDEIILNCKLVPNEIVDSEEDALCSDYEGLEYNVDKYIDQFNKRITPLLVCFHPDIRNKILVTDPKDKMFFTEAQSKLVSGFPNKEGDQDTFEALMTPERKEIEFWTSINEVPPFVKECNIDWDKLVADYKAEIEKEKDEIFQIENKKYIDALNNLTDADIEAFEEEGKLPASFTSIVTLGSDMRLYFKKIPDKTPSTGGFVFDDIMYSFIETNEG
jgi:DNA polymerase elongation subunit (family B)